MTAWDVFAVIGVVVVAACLAVAVYIGLQMYWRNEE